MPEAPGSAPDPGSRARDGWDRVGLEDLPDGVVVVGGDGRVLAVNQAAVTLLGRDRAALVGAPVRRALPFQDTSGRRWWDLLPPDGRTTEPSVEATRRERLLLLPGGTEVLVTVGRGRSGPGGPTGTVLVCLRGTEERQRAETDAAGLIATVAHELRSPLTSVKQFTATLLRRWDRFSDDQKRLMLSTVEADADRVTRLVGDLLDVSGVDNGRLRVHRRPFDLPELVRSHVERLVLAGYDDDRFQLRLGPDLPEVWADPDRMAQVVTNLVENAVRHGAGTVTIDIAHDRAAHDLVLTVDDEGEGIEEENRPYVFSKFWHGGARSGTGLGLYVVRGLLEAHDGSIEVGRSPAGGARFEVRLPVGEPAAAVRG
ncbi:sensor histidine kinase [Kineococcus gynurae]|uniref:histidine kinase n=1 Tax=Kineococcus gynurae TaxID=452979 RepID=A0ABV5LXW4_9ACTN